MRHRLPHFQHLFSGGGYAAGYYSYMWSEVLDADAFEAFEETGNVFDPATAQRLRDYIYSAGNLRDPAEAYKAFRGRLPAVDALLEEARARRRRAGMNLHTAGHRRGVVCAPHAAAVEDGRAILAEGGNAIEAMLAMAASIAAVYPHMNHIGGDGFWLIREPSGRVRAHHGRRAAPAPRRRRSSIATPATTRSRRAGRSPRSPCRARWRLDAGARGRQGANRQRPRQAAARMCCLTPPSSTRARATR